jgi:hypothetical protein
MFFFKIEKKRNFFKRALHCVHDFQEIKENGGL